MKLAIKFLVTAVLLWLVFRKVDLGAVSQLISGLDPWWAAVAILMTGLIVFFDATMLVEVMRIFARRMQFGTALLYSIVGWFFSNVAPSTVGGDVFRGLQFSRVGVPIGTAIRIILSIRVLSFVTLVLVIAAGFPIALGLLKQPRDVLLLGTVLSAGVGAVLLLVLLAFVPPRIAKLDQWRPFAKLMTLAGDFRTLLIPSVRSASTWLAALAQHLLRVGALAALAAGLGLGIPLATLFAFTTAALLMAMLPISFGGWGVREIAFVYLLGAAGVSAEAALSLSIAFGLLRVLVGAIGGLIWLLTNDEHLRVDAPSV